MSYLDDYAEANNKYKVVLYTDHFFHSRRYFKEFRLALEYYDYMNGQLTDARHSNTLFMMDVETNGMIMNTSWLNLPGVPLKKGQ